MWPFIVAIVAILAWALTRIIQSGTQSGAEWAKVAQAQGGEEMETLKKQVALLKSERDRLVQRVENLEAIVTSEAFDLEREARRAIPAPPGRELPEAGGVPPLALDEHEAGHEEDDAARAARLARRVRGG